MTALKSLTFTTLPKVGANPTMDRRANVIARLEEQKRLVSDPAYVRTIRTWVKKDGQRTPVDKQQRVLPWWRVNQLLPGPRGVADSASSTSVRRTLRSR
jgi:hypothetical protein